MEALHRGGEIVDPLLGLNGDMRAYIAQGFESWSLSSALLLISLSNSPLPFHFLCT